ncbi:MAG: hypothetical protein R2764_26080 [Bacteroidales bacterium]
MNKPNQRLSQFFQLFIIGLILFSFSCKPEKVDLCNQYEEFFGNIKYEMSKQDSADTYEYFQYFKKIITKNHAPYGGDPYGFGMLYRIKRTDTSFSNEITREFYGNRSHYIEKYGVDYYLARNIVNSDAVVYGEVVSKKNYSDSCLFFTTTYIVRVDSVLFSYFPIEIGNKVIIKTSNFGYEGGCKTGIQKRMFTSTSHSYDFNENEFSLFLLSKSHYIMAFNKFILNNPKFYDKFCYNSFIALNNPKLNGLIAKSNPESLNEFISHIQKK